MKKTVSDDVAAVLADVLHERYLNTLRWSVLRARIAANQQLEALTKAGYAVVKVPEPAGWVAEAATRQAELDEYGYFSANAEQDRDHPVPLFTIEDTP